LFGEALVREHISSTQGGEAITQDPKFVWLSLT
jgi:hypothetical protein